MVVQHNLTAMNSNRMLGVTTGSQAKSTEKLSSGYKINRAADDAAGLSISEKMRKQIRGLTQASLNAEDGISAVQTAEGALNEVQDMLQRANELAVKSANGTMSENDRNYIQDEIDQLMTEIDRVSTTTKFNETYLLKGDAKKTTLETDATYNLDGLTIAKSAGDEIVSGDKVLLGTVTKGAATLTGTAGATGTVADSVTAGTYTYAAATDVYALELGAGEKLYKAVFDGTDFAVTEVTGDAAIKQAYDDLNGTAAKDADYKANATAASANGNYTYFVSTATTVGADLTKDAIEALDGQAYGVAGDTSKTTKEAGFYNGATKLDETGLTFTDKTAGKTVIVARTADSLTNAAGITGTYTGDMSELEGGDEVYGYFAVDGEGNVTISATEPTNVDPLVLKLHVGADSTDDNQISVSIESMSADGLGLLNEDGKLLVNGKDDTNARAAIDTIAAALQQVSTQRSALGAVQNRLEHTIANLDNVVENTTAAESQIRDTDMATEMVRYSNNNILAQAGTSMLAQANQANQNILSLLG